MSVRQLPSGKWEARPRIRGKRLSQAFSTKSEAKRWAARQIADYERGTFVDPQAGMVPLSTWADRWLETRTNVQPRVINEKYRPAISRFVDSQGHRPLVGIQKVDVEAWIGDLVEEGLAPSTISGYLTVVRSMFRSAVDNRVLTHNPAEGVKAPRVQQAEMHFLTPPEIDRLDQAMGGQGIIVAFLGYTALRWSEMAGLRVAQLDLLRGEVRVVRQQHREGTKTYKSRTVPLEERLWHRLREHVAGKEANELVFTSPRGRPLRAPNFRKRFAKAKQDAGIDPAVRPHDLRHSCASNLIAAGVDVRTVGEWLGHSASYITDRYVHTTPDRLREAARRLTALRDIDVELSTVAPVSSPTSGGWMGDGRATHGK